MSAPIVQGKGRPLRFLALVGLAWVGARVAFLGPFAGEPETKASFDLVPGTGIAVASPSHSPVTTVASVPEQNGSPTGYSSVASPSSKDVENLEPAPPANLIAPVPDNPGAMHNMLWMKASIPDMGSLQVAPAESAPAEPDED